MQTNFFHISRAHISKSKRYFNVKSYNILYYIILYLQMRTKILKSAFLQKHVEEKLGHKNLPVITNKYDSYKKHRYELVDKPKRQPNKIFT